MSSWFVFLAIYIAEMRLNFFKSHKRFFSVLIFIFKKKVSRKAIIIRSRVRARCSLGFSILCFTYHAVCRSTVSSRRVMVGKNISYELTNAVDNDRDVRQLLRYWWCEREFKKRGEQKFKRFQLVNRKGRQTTFGCRWLTWCLKNLFSSRSNFSI